MDVSGAVLFALVGVGILLVSGGDRRALLMGATAATFGLTWVFQNFSSAPHPWVARTGVIVFSSLCASAIVVFAHQLVRGSSRRAKLHVAAIGVAVALAWVVFHVMRIAYLIAHDAEGDAWSFVYSGAYGAFLFALILLAGAIAAAFRDAGPAPRALACLGLAFAPFVTFLFAAFAATAAFEPQLWGTGADVFYLVLGALGVVAILPFARSRGSADPLSRKVFPMILAFGLGGLVLALTGAPSYDYGSFGIVRTFGAFFLALAVLKFDLLGVPLPRLAARRGTVAAGALAALFIVAEVAQNFLSAEYGLLMGSVVAGALLFATSPIQRAMERVGEQGTRVIDARAPARDAARRETVFREALRVALRDKRVTRAEEVHLHRLAEELGIGAGRAHEILVQAEEESEAA